ncbi:YkgJ family cysteine cluster protein [Desulfogranum mediterraneum]|uniref:YkgJ family cysteine cluster protein n=1 Tax=Desulfogranum mediterraneum TaxID=160661 RepID=UPI0003FF099D|nr:YkgJ family cysteine cluster protein [Desulfogranum mediterraneum]
MEKEVLTQGMELLRRPVLPLVSMVEFFLLTGDFAVVGEVIEQLPDPIETEYARYDDPAALLAPYLEPLQWLIEVSRSAELPFTVQDVAGEELDLMSAATAIVDQRILTAELEQINSLLCAPCGCTLCCTGPEAAMKQDFFEIPLQEEEVGRFAVEQLDSPASRRTTAHAEESLRVDGIPFYERPDSGLVHWADGWSLILPQGSRCPNLEAGSGRCLVYPDRPQVCRRPQIFPYILEPVRDARGQLLGQRLRRSLLAVVDCPYVAALQDEIAAYAAASELELVFKRNKE